MPTVPIDPGAAVLPPPMPRPLARGWPIAGGLRLAARRLGGYGVVVGLALLLWEAAIRGFEIPHYLMPPPGEALQAFVERGREIASATALTLEATLVGMAAATGIAIALALAFLASPVLDAALMPLVVLLRTVPMIAIAPVLVLVFGRDRWNGIGMVALLSFFQILLAARKGLEAPTRHMRELMHCCGAGFWQTVVKLRLPCALTHLFTGLRIASGSAVLCAMFAEWLSGAPGLGSLILDAHARQQFELMWAAVVAGTTVSYCFFTFTIALERMVHDWSR